MQNQATSDMIHIALIIKLKVFLIAVYDISNLFFKFDKIALILIENNQYNLRYYYVMLRLIT